MTTDQKGQRDQEASEQRLAFYVAEFEQKYLDYADALSAYIYSASGSIVEFTAKSQLSKTTYALMKAEELRRGAEYAVGIFESAPLVLEDAVTLKREWLALDD